MSSPSKTLPSLGELVPHRPPMLLLDEVLAFDGDTATCAVTLREDAMFAEHGRVPAWVALEYCAQCVAAFAGLRARAEGRPPQLGLLVAARDLVLECDFFAAGDRLVVHARLEFGELRVGRFACEVRREGAVVAKASLSVYQPEGRDAGRDQG
jgi:predicted hotdog family 3-hydroxylacyl-ACP dehydratase